MEDDCVPLLDRPDSLLTNLPCHNWRDQWTALLGPLSRGMNRPRTPSQWTEFHAIILLTRISTRMTNKFREIKTPRQSAWQPSKNFNLSRPGRHSGTKAASPLHFRTASVFLEATERPFYRAGAVRCTPRAFLKCFSESRVPS